MCESKFQLCPICYGDTLYFLEINSINDVVKICLECDSVWLGDVEVTPETAISYSTFLQDYQLNIILDATVYDNPVRLET